MLISVESCPTLIRELYAHVVDKFLDVLSFLMVCDGYCTELFLNLLPPILFL